MSDSKNEDAPRGQFRDDFGRAIARMMGTAPTPQAAWSIASTMLVHDKMPRGLEQDLRSAFFIGAEWCFHRMQNACEELSEDDACAFMQATMDSFAAYAEERRAELDARKENPIPKPKSEDEDTHK